MEDIYVHTNIPIAVDPVKEVHALIHHYEKSPRSNKPLELAAGGSVQHRCGGDVVAVFFGVDEDYAVLARPDDVAMGLGEVRARVRRGRCRSPNRSGSRRHGRRGSRGPGGSGRNGGAILAARRGWRIEFTLVSLCVGSGYGDGISIFKGEKRAR